MIVIGSELRHGNIWENVELPMLKDNVEVTKITIIDPLTGVESVILEKMKITGNRNYIEFDMDNGIWGIYQEKSILKCINCI